MHHSLRRFYQDQTDNYPDDDDAENFMFCDDAIGHCNICGSPIFDGDSVYPAGGEDAIAVDRHGAVTVVRIPEMMMHKRYQDCREED